MADPETLQRDFDGTLSESDTLSEEVALLTAAGAVEQVNSNRDLKLLHWLLARTYLHVLPDGCQVDRDERFSIIQRQSHLPGTDRVVLRGVAISGCAIRHTSGLQP